MNDLNSVLLQGRLTKDPVVGESKNGKPYTFITLASNRFYQDPEEPDVWRQVTTYVDVRSFNGRAEEMAKLHTGQAVRLTGSMSSASKMVGETKISEIYVTPLTIEPLE